MKIIATEERLEYNERDFKNRYFYYYPRYDTKEISRVLIVRETNNFWITDKGKKIRKSDLSSGSGWEREHFYEETEEIKNKFMETMINRKFQKILNILKDSDDMDLKKEIITIAKNRGIE